MAIQFPTNLDTLNTPTANTTIAGHASNHTDVATGIEALEAKVGVNGSAVATSLDYLVTNASSSDPGHTHTLSNGATDVTASVTELNYVDGVTSAIQTQLNAKEPTITTLTVAKGGTGATTLTGVLVGTGTTAVTAVTAPSGTIVGTTDTQTVTGKRIEPRIVSATSYTTDTGTSLSVATADIFQVTAQAGALKFNNPGGTPVEGQKLIVRIKDSGAPRALTYDTEFRAMGTALPTTTVTSKTLYLGFIRNHTDTKWDLVAAAQEA